ncbi:methyltransferase [Humibacter soli]
MAQFEWARLRRWPDAEAGNLFASDAADRLIADTATDVLDGVISGGVARDGVIRDGVISGEATRDGVTWDGATRDDVAVVGDSYGALTLWAASTVSEGGVIRVHQDAVLAERALDANAERLGLSGAYRSYGLDVDLVRGARVMLLRLPKSLDALDEIAGVIAANADPAVTVFAGGMQKHLTVAMNDVLARHFERVDVGLARQKARVLTVTGPKTDVAQANAAAAATTAEPWPRRQFHPDIAPGVWVCAHGGAFAGTRIDIGTRFLLSHLDEARPDAQVAVDLACGTGVLATTLALRRPGVRVIATDQSAVAVASARATAEANGVADRIEVRREDAGDGIPDACADLVLLNPPFHNGSALDLRVGRMLVAAASRMLAPGGELWTVYNSHLDYKPVLRDQVGPTRQMDRNAKFTITVSTRR